MRTRASSNHFRIIGTIGLSLFLAGSLSGPLRTCPHHDALNRDGDHAPVATHPTSHSSSASKNEHHKSMPLHMPCPCLGMCHPQFGDWALDAFNVLEQYGTLISKKSLPVLSLTRPRIILPYTLPFPNAPPLPI